jgi:hypothetical protein
MRSILDKNYGLRLTILPSGDFRDSIDRASIS